jgi:carbonic anhydrase
MQKLIEGIHHFQSEIFGSQRELFQRLADGQRPDALFITCSDSRINPNLLTQTEPGETDYFTRIGLQNCPPWRRGWPMPIRHVA